MILNNLKVRVIDLIVIVRDFIKIFKIILNNRNRNKNIIYMIDENMLNAIDLNTIKNYLRKNKLDNIKKHWYNIKIKSNKNLYYVNCKIYTSDIDILDIIDIKNIELYLKNKRNEKVN